MSVSFELSAKVDSTRTLPPIEGRTRFESTYIGTGQLLGHAVKHVVTYISEEHKTGSHTGTGQASITTLDGASSASYVGWGAVVREEGASAWKWRAYFVFRSVSPAFAEWNGSILDAEITVHDDGRVTQRVEPWT